MAEKLPLSKKIIYALGQFGWSLASFAVANVLTFFYMPPESGDSALFPTFIYQGAILGIITVIGLINAGSRFFDAVSDPIVANLTDRCKSPFGRRRKFMAIGAFPFALFSFLVFFPLVGHESIINSLWLVFTIIAFYLSLTLYCVPYNALISELGHTPDERLFLSTIISITWALGFALGNQIYLLRKIFMDSFGMSSTHAFQTAVGIFSFISLILMYLPVIFIDERKYAEFHVSEEGVISSLKTTFKNKNFRLFVFSDLTYWLSMTFIQTGISYYIIVLLGLDEALPSKLMFILFILSFLFYVPINISARKFGKKAVLSAAFFIFAIVFGLVAFLGKLPISATQQAYLVVILSAIPIAIFGIIPNAIVADIAEAHGKETGNYKAGIFFGARTFMMKVGISVGNLLFPSFLLLGKSQGNDLGVRLTGFAAFIFCTIGLLLFLTYNEKYILSVLNKDENK